MIKILFFSFFWAGVALIVSGQSDILQQQSIQILRNEIDDIGKKINMQDAEQGKHVERFSKKVHELFLVTTSGWNKKKRDKKWDEEVFQLLHVNEDKQVILNRTQYNKTRYYLVVPGMSKVQFNPVLIQAHCRPIVWNARSFTGEYLLDVLKEDKKNAKIPKQKKLESLGMEIERLEEKINQLDSEQKQDITRFSKLIHELFLTKTKGLNKKTRDKKWEEEVFYLVPINASKQIIFNSESHNQVQYYLVVSGMFRVHFNPILIRKQYRSAIWSARNGTDK